MLYGLLGAMLLPASMALYKRRNIESAGDVVAIASVRPVFKYVCALACAFILGNMLYTLPFGNSPRDGSAPLWCTPRAWRRAPSSDTLEPKCCSARASPCSEAAGLYRLGPDRSALLRLCSVLRAGRDWI